MNNYHTAIEETASTIFLNFYKIRKDELPVLSHDDADDLMYLISDQYQRTMEDVENDIADNIKWLISKIPNEHVIDGGIIFH